MRNGTWELVKLPPGRTTIKNKWLFKIKRGQNNIPERFKARLAAKGFTQQGIDYGETFAPVVKSPTIKILLSLIAVHDLEAIQLDIKTAFLYGELEEEIYMDQPEGFIMPGKESEVCRLKKAIYGLKQAPRCWNTKFNDFLQQFGLKQTPHDPCLYARRQGEDFIAAAIFLDDGLIASNKKELLEAVCKHLTEVFEMRVNPLGRFLGLNIRRDRSNKRIHIDQTHFIEEILTNSTWQLAIQLASLQNQKCA